MKDFLIILPILMWPAKAEQIDWYVSAFYPCHIFDGPYKDQGLCDITLKKVINYLPQFEHDMQPVSLRKIMASAESDVSFCTDQLLKTPQRQEHLIFSDLVYSVLSVGLIVRSNDQRFQRMVDSQGRISLQTVFNKNEYVFGREVGRSYGDALAPLITEDVLQVDINQNLSFKKLLREKRVDFTIGYAAYLLNAQTKDTDIDLSYIPILENQSLFDIYFSCKNDAHGQKVIGEINKVIQKLGANYFQRIYKDWLTPEARAYYEQVLESTQNQK